MAMSGASGLSLRVLVVLAMEPDAMLTSAVIAEKLGTSPVMVRRVFASLGAAGLIVQRKGPHGGARLKMAAKSIGLGTVFTACAGEWLMTGDKAVDAALGRAREDAVKAMNETTLAGVVKRLRKQHAENKA